MFLSFSDRLYQNLIASNKRVNVLNVVCELVGRTGTFFLELFWWQERQTPQGHKLGTGPFLVSNCKSSREGGGQAEQCPARAVCTGEGLPAFRGG